MKKGGFVKGGWTGPSERTCYVSVVGEQEKERNPRTKPTTKPTRPRPEMIANRGTATGKPRSPPRRLASLAVARTRLELGDGHELTNPTSPSLLSLRRRCSFLCLFSRVVRRKWFGYLRRHI